MVGGSIGGSIRLEVDSHFQVDACSVTFRIQARPGHLSKRSEAISVARLHSEPPTSSSTSGYRDSGSRASISSIVESGTKGKTTNVHLQREVSFESIRWLTFGESNQSGITGDVEGCGYDICDKISIFQISLHRSLRHVTSSVVKPRSIN